MGYSSRILQSRSVEATSLHRRLTLQDIDDGIRVTVKRALRSSSVNNIRVFDRTKDLYILPFEDSGPKAPYSILLLSPTPARHGKDLAVGDYYAVGMVLLDPELPKQSSWARTPHTSLFPEFQGKGIASAIYRWALDNRWCLVSSESHTKGARALWQSLSRSYPLIYIDVRTNEFVTENDHKRRPNDVSMMLLGKGWTPEKVRLKMLLNN